MKTSLVLLIAMLGLALPRQLGAATDTNWVVLPRPLDAEGCVTLAGGTHDAVVLVDTNDYAVVQLAANFFCG